jgi:hypothetical protein
MRFFERARCRDHVGFVQAPGNDFLAPRAVARKRYAEEKIEHGI